MLTLFDHHIESIKALIDAGADVNQADNEGLTALMISAERADLNLMEMLLKAGAEVNEIDDFGVTALMFAAKNGHAQIIKRLLTAGADINAVSSTGVTALMIAAQHGHMDVIKVLCNAGVKIDAVDESGKTALRFAIQQYQHTNLTSKSSNKTLNPTLVKPKMPIIFSSIVGRRNFFQSLKTGLTNCFKPAVLASIDAAKIEMVPSTGLKKKNLVKG